MAVIEVGESDIYTVFVKMSTKGKVNLTVDGKCVCVQTYSCIQICIQCWQPLNCRYCRPRNFRSTKILQLVSFLGLYIFMDKKLHSQLWLQIVQQKVLSCFPNVYFS